MQTRRTTILAAAFLLGSVHAASGQSARQVLESAAERYQQRMQGIDNYTLVQDVMGMESILYFEKETVDGVPFFQVRAARVGGNTISLDDDQTLANPYRTFMDFADRARHDGTEAVDGRQAHRIVVEDFTGLDFNPAPSGQRDGQFTPRRVVMYIDADDHLVRRMDMEGDMTSPRGTAPVSTTARFEDYRTTDGLLHHWRTTMVTEGVMEAAGMSAADREKARQQLAEMEKQMETMPAAQRQMMERMMAGQMDRLREMVESGTLEITTEVKAIRVNQGAP
ncbi:MAG TPA: hypothetical protein VK936_14035 [Longimicrobiales bacterium]|nr:hypothetical protein [Longimicrobiales bacterium]